MSGNHTSKEPAKPNGNESGEKRASLAGELHRSIYGSTQIRSAILFVLIFAAYALIVVVLTTDLVLLREGEIILPFIQVGVPVVGFYVVAPLLIVLLHLNVLGRLIMLARDINKRGDGKVQVNNNARSNDETSEGYGVSDMVLTMLFPTDPERLMSARREATRPITLLSVVFFIQVATVPLLVLLVLQVRFLAYQHEEITLFHQIIITVDLFFQYDFIRYFYNFFRDGKEFRRIRRATIVFVFLPFLYVWTVALVPGSFNEKMVKFDLQIIEGERFINVPNRIISLRDPPPEIVGAIIQVKNKSNPEIHCEHVGELDLNSRRLNFANFSGSKFLCAKMQGTQLNNAKLVDVDLSEANLTGANLTGANLGVARLGGAVLNSAKLNKANLAGAILNKALLKGADLSEAELRGAKLIDVQLVTAKLNKADLSDADLSDADLRGADLSEAKLSRAKLSTAIFVGANLSGANLSGADLSDADLSGANLSGANLSGADLSGAKLYGARLYEAQLSDTTLEGAKLYGANFSGSTLRGTSLDKADGNEPKGWVTILYKIKRGLKLGGHSQGKIDSSVAMIVRSSTLTQGYVSSTGTDHCVLYVGKPELNLPPECAEARRLK